MENGHNKFLAIQQVIQYYITDCNITELPHMELMEILFWFFIGAAAMAFLTGKYSEGVWFVICVIFIAIGTGT